jgi:hypothetical protein
MVQAVSVRELVERQVASSARILAEVRGVSVPRVNTSTVGALWQDAYELLCDLLVDEYEADLLDYVSARDIAVVAVAMYLDDGTDGEWFDAALACLRARYDRLLERLND